MNDKDKLFKSLQLFKTIPNEFFYLGSHGCIDISKRKINYNILPSNVSIVFLSPIGHSISEKMNTNSTSFFTNKSELLDFKKNPGKFSLNSKYKGLSKVIIVPPGAPYIDQEIEIPQHEFRSNWEKNQLGLYKLPYNGKNKDMTQCFKKYSVNPQKEEYTISSYIKSFMSTHARARDCEGISTKGGILFVDTCRFLWSELKGKNVNRRFCRQSGTVHRTVQNVNFNGQSFRNGRKVNIEEIKSNDIHNLNKLMKFKDSELETSDNFKKLFLKKIKKSSILTQYSISSQAEKEANNKLNYSKQAVKKIENSYLKYTKKKEILMRKPEVINKKSKVKYREGNSLTAQMKSLEI